MGAGVGGRGREEGDFRQLAQDNPQVPNDTKKGIFSPVNCSLAISPQEMKVVTKCVC